ncbi:hypothetical protein EIP91_010311 [Steccherinum ochraceum]|uniref:MYND-type domain-containing protein n=1 Tax=Steccherinum ochraceum TaxID=92696 RepID=A0A4R0RD13_9APHY|nr:hypothetical protein EIP91_010311 [Steccherinum ochraceum]
MFCEEGIESLKKPLRCSACKAVIYCSKGCAKSGWKQNSKHLLPGYPTHHDLCASYARYMKRLPDVQAIVQQFPWGRIESDGSFNKDIARGRFNVLGKDNVGFWSHRGGPIPHQDNGPDRRESLKNSDEMKWLSIFDHLDGKDLLKSNHLSDEDGWRLPAKLIPFRDFPSAEKRPVLVAEFGEPVKDWDSWYRWRKLSKESPAALIMDFPMSAYQLVVKCLEVTNATKGTASKRVPLHIEMLGVEVELNFLPAYLALLLPFHDIKLVMVGYSVHKLCQEARKYPKSLVAKCSTTTPIFAYKAPNECGSGSIQVFLHGASPLWSADDLPFGRPDALVACNAGLATYTQWYPVIQSAHLLDIPFATTEYGEKSCEHQLGTIRHVMVDSGMARKLRQFDQYKIDLNPFQRPGQRDVGMLRTPNLVNGFTLVVVKEAM